MLNFYVYVDGSDLDECAASLTHAFSKFVASSNLGIATLVSTQHPRTPDLQPEDVPQWDLGINFSIPMLSEAGATSLVAFLIELSQQTGREFVIGLWHHDSHISNDLMFIGANSSIGRGTEFCLLVNGR